MISITKTKLSKNRKILYILTSLFISIFIPKIATAQITADGTLPTHVNNSSGIYDITGGANPDNGINLFHSLQNLSLQSGETARFIHNSGIENIITRITGGSLSQIDGTIQTLINKTENISNANLFLINPKGIIFGEKSRLDMGGSFIASTADSIKFADGTEFSATQPLANPLLTISVPLGLQFGSNPHSIIQVNGSGNKLISDPENYSLDDTNRPNGLHYETPNGQTLALVGGNVIFDGGNMTLPDGRVELWSINQGFVSLININGKLELQPTSEIKYGNIDLLKAASINASGDSGGIIQVRGENINLQDGSVIFTNTDGYSDNLGGTLNVFAAELLSIQGYILNADNKIFSSIFANLEPNAFGSGGNVFIDSKMIKLSHGGQISANTFGFGNPGELTVKSQHIQIIGHPVIGSSGLFATVFLGDDTKGGHLTIETETLQVLQGGQIFTSTYGSGKAGELTIKAQDIEVRGESKLNPSSIFATVQKGQEINSYFSNLEDTQLGGTGQGNNLFIKTRNLRVLDSGQIGVSTSASGNAGNLEIQAESIDLTGFNPRGRSGLFANAIRGTGDAGNIKVTTNQLKISDGAIISVSNFHSQNRVPPGQGAAGNIEINAPILLLENQGIITADTNAGDQGNISIQSQNLQMRQGSQISSNARNSSSGGNITITTDTLVALENSDITANAQKGFGGRVVINAKGVFGTEFRPYITFESDITATSELGWDLNGTVEINTPDIDPTAGLVELPDIFIDAESLVDRNICTNTQITEGSSFMKTGTGGLPANSEDLITNSPGITEWVNRPVQANKLPVVLRQRPKHNDVQEQIQQRVISQAQGWMITANGKVILTKEAFTNLTPHSPHIVHPSCYISTTEIIAQDN